MIYQTRILFDRERFNHDLLQKKVFSAISYFSAPDLPDGEYLWQNNLIKPSSIIHILSTSIVRIINGKMIPVWDNNEMQILLIKSLTALNSDILYDILFDLKDYYHSIRVIIKSRVIFTKSFNDELLYYIDEITKINFTVLSNLYLSVLYFLKDDIIESEKHLLFCNELIIKHN